jgi:hypothetical protein
MFGDVHHPEAVWALGVELAADEIIAGHPSGIAAGAAPRTTPIDAGDTGLAHESLDPLAGAVDLLTEAQLGMDPR